jgi:hypothetical protein
MVSGYLWVNPFLVPLFRGATRLSLHIPIKSTALDLNHVANLLHRHRLVGIEFLGERNLNLLRVTYLDSSVCRQRGHTPDFALERTQRVERMEDELTAGGCGIDVTCTPYLIQE